MNRTRPSSPRSASSPCSPPTKSPATTDTTLTGNAAVLISAAGACAAPALPGPRSRPWISTTSSAGRDGDVHFDAVVHLANRNARRRRRQREALRLAPQCAAGVLEDEQLRRARAVNDPDNQIGEAVAPVDVTGGSAVTSPAKRIRSGASKAPRPSPRSRKSASRPRARQSPRPHGHRHRNRRRR